jgi:hypothetical protein
MMVAQRTSLDNNTLPAAGMLGLILFKNRLFVKHFRLAKLFQRYQVGYYTTIFSQLNADDESEAIGFNVETVEVTWY